MTTETPEKITVEPLVGLVGEVTEVHPDQWFAVAGQEFGIVDGEPVAFCQTPATYMTEGGPFSGTAREITPDLLKWMKMKRAVFTVLISRVDAWIALAGPVVAMQTKADEEVLRMAARCAAGEEETPEPPA